MQSKEPQHFTSVTWHTKICPLGLVQNNVISKLFQNKACKKHWKQELHVTVKTLGQSTERSRNFQDVLVQSQILFCKRAGTVSVNAINASKGWGWLPSQLFWVKPSKSFNECNCTQYFFTIFKQTFWSLLAYQATLIVSTLTFPPPPFTLLVQITATFLHLLCRQ